MSGLSPMRVQYMNASIRRKAWPLGQNAPAWTVCARARSSSADVVSGSWPGTLAQMPSKAKRGMQWLMVGLLVACSAATPADPYASRRDALLAAIAADARLTVDDTGHAQFAPGVMQAMARVPRHEFVPEGLKPFAYENRPLPIGHGQTISQPYIVALMTELAGVGADAVVLEIGTGSGYQAAILATLTRHVYTIEIIEPLARAAEERLKRLGYENVTSRLGDGYHGWSEHAPFDAILVTAAASHVPPPLVKQLKAGGRMVIPVGGRFLTQQLLLVEKNANGEIRTRQVLPVRFVPLTGGH